METGIVYAVIASFLGTTQVFKKGLRVARRIFDDGVVRRLDINTVGVFFAGDSESGSGERPVERRFTLTSLSATLCYGIVPVLKKFGTDHGGSPVLGALVMHASGLMLLLAFGSFLKIALKGEKIPAASVFCFVSAGVLYALGSIMTLKALIHAPASVVAPIWSAQPIVTFLFSNAALKGIEDVTIKDGVAAALVVIGVLMLRLG